MTGNEIRETFLRYFEEHGHMRVKSSPLLPANDPTLLFANAGMNQFKDVFLGNEKREYTRAASSQKCLRAGGKHNDLDEVGKTARHHTFFEMLGNFSFGDYFKRDAIRFAWDLLVNRLKLDPERLWFTVFAGDDEVPADEEAIALWQEVGARSERILRFGRKDNFWQMAETGPCGPNSEINYYLGEHPEDPNFNRADLVNGAGDLTMEIWNLVFMQYNRVESEPGKYKLEPLPAPSVDTGMGLERMAVVMQGKLSNYDTDLIKPIIEFTAQLAGIEYQPDSTEGFAMRVIADHARATAFAITDGIYPGNEGRNYVLRKIMRRAIYHGRNTLKFNDEFFYKVTNHVVDRMREAYPELETSRSSLEKIMRLEEERFGSTLTVGLKKLEELIKTPYKVCRVEDLARLKDTYGTPTDLMYVFLSKEEGFLVLSAKNAIGELEPYRTFLVGRELSGEEFGQYVEKAIKELQRTSEISKAKQNKPDKPAYIALSRRIDTRSEFKGYEATKVNNSKIVALIKDDDEVQTLGEGDEGEIVLDRTPFYAEAGGQVGDTGLLINDSTRVFVEDTFAPMRGLTIHRVRVERGTVKVGDVFTAQVDAETRDATRRNHTATHLLHAALREVLGTHVKQAGSLVAPNRLRFDFTHFQPLTRDEIAEIERLVNYHILRNVRVETNILALEEAMRSGAMALFGEKYGEKVRVLTVPGVSDGFFSRELCGGTHVRATGDIGLFKIVRDEAVASGVRRVEAVTGADAFTRFQDTEALVDGLSNELRAPREKLTATVERLQEELKRARREADELRLKLATGASASNGNSEDIREVEGVKVLAREASDLDSSALRQLSDTLLARIKSGVVVIGRRDTENGKASLIVRTSSDLQKRVPAGQVIKELAPLIGGRGGGRPDMAEGGGSLAHKLPEALTKSYEIIAALLKNGAN